MTYCKNIWHHHICPNCDQQMDADNPSLTLCSDTWHDGKCSGCGADSDTEFPVS